MIDAPVVVILLVNSGCQTDGPLAIFSHMPPSSVPAEFAVPQMLSQASECWHWWHNSPTGLTGGAFEELAQFFSGTPERISVLALWHIFLL